MSTRAALWRFVALGLPALALGCGGDAVEAPPVVPPVMVAEVGAYRIEDRIEATGELQAPAEATVGAQVDGQVTHVRVDEGEGVEAGAVVLEIDPERRQLEVDSQRAQLVEVEARLAERRRDVERIRTLHARGVASDARLDEVETQLRLARSQQQAATARLGLAERALRDAWVQAPFAGFVGRRYVSEGEFVGVGTPLFDLVALDPIEVAFHLPERDSGRVSIGAPVQVSVAPFPDEIFRAAVTTIAPTIDPETRTLRVKARIENSDGRLRPGLFARADLGVAEREGVPMVPEEAVLQRADGAVAFRMDGDEQVERRTLRLGVRRAGRVEVVEGLSVGDHVVVRGQVDLVDGSRVSLRDAAGKPLVGTDATAAAGPEATGRP